MSDEVTPEPIETPEADASVPTEETPIDESSGSSIDTTSVTEDPPPTSTGGH